MMMGMQGLMGEGLLEPGDEVGFGSRVSDVGLVIRTTTMMSMPTMMRVNWGCHGNICGASAFTALEEVGLSDIPIQIQSLQNGIPMVIGGSCCR
jgi:hypothetical protein